MGRRRLPRVDPTRLSSCLSSVQGKLHLLGHIGLNPRALQIPDQSEGHINRWVELRPSWTVSEESSESHYKDLQPLGKKPVNRPGGFRANPTASPLMPVTPQQVRIVMPIAGVGELPGAIRAGLASEFRSLTQVSYISLHFALLSS